MGKASSNKKVARAAKAGGSKARAAGERNVLFPIAMVLVVVLGVALIVYARDERRAEALASPTIGEHWHSAYGFYACDTFLPAVPEFIAPRNIGNHSHGDGLFHLHPFSTEGSGENATMGNWISAAGEVLGNDGGLSDTALHVPGGETFTEGESTCEGLEGEPILQVAFWDRGQAALAEEDPDEIITEDLGSIRFEKDGQAFTIAFAPEGAEIPPPPSSNALLSVGADIGVDGDVPEEYGGEGTDAPSSTDTDESDDESTDESPSTSATDDE